MSGELIASFELNFSTQVQSANPVQVGFRIIMYDGDEPSIVDFLARFFLCDAEGNLFHVYMGMTCGTASMLP